MLDDKTPAPDGLTVNYVCSLLIGLALGTGFGMLINLPLAGIGTGLAMGSVSNLARRKGGQNWMIWLGCYSALVLVAYGCKLAGVFR